MASRPLSPSLRSTLHYFRQFNYPLTQSELWFWQHGTSYSKSKINSLSPNSKQTTPNWRLRRIREKISQKKWLIAKKVGESLEHIPFIQAIFVTGALSMNNSPKYDDIDFMIITSPHSLWLTRFLAYLYLDLFLRIRRPTSLPEHASPRVSGKICDNLYLDTTNLLLQVKSLYVAHEILQAKCIFDSGGIHRRFLTQNAWVKTYLPVAYTQILQKIPQTKTIRYPLYAIRYFLWPINLLLFVLQYLYMLPKITSERIGPGFAFFHPQLKISTPRAFTMDTHRTDPHF